MNLKSTFILFVFLSFIIISCEKEPFQLETKIEGSWELFDASSRYGTAVSPMVTGYEDGTFIFYKERNANSGKVEYKEAAVFMEGTWQLKAIEGRYDEDDGEWHDSGKREMTLYLQNSTGTKILDWKFPKLDFTSSTKFVGVLYGNNGYEYRYEFRKL